MSKISVFKFQVQDSVLANNIMKDYLENEEYEFNENYQCFIGGEWGNFAKCLKYEIVNDELIIKAFTENVVTGIKNYIHIPINTSVFGRNYYDELQNNLFKILNDNNISLISTTKEKVKDNGYKNLIKMLLIVEIPIIIIITIITLIVYFSTH